jgi:hypothetical protein
MTKLLISPRRQPPSSLFLPDDQARVPPRYIWAATRFWMETEGLKSRRYGGKSHHHWYALLYAMRSFEWLLKRVGGYERGRRNAADARLFVSERLLDRQDERPHQSQERLRIDAAPAGRVLAHEASDPLGRLADFREPVDRGGARQPMRHVVERSRDLGIQPFSCSEAAASSMA